ncbi:MAG: glycoside hydrolase family 130 protein [Gammaproteobacteria bacterium]|nr:glycoside hydrolase family 130 protein [Gammaproteobacteria bacterium]
MPTPVIERYAGNPILTRDDVPYPVATVHNAGVVKHNGQYIMLFRSHLDSGRSIIGRADSKDGFQFTVQPEPFLTPAKEGAFAEYEAFGVEDLRICPVEDYYLLCYSAYSRHGVRIGLARTYDFENVERIAFISQADMRNAVIFPEKIDGRYVRLDRPHSEISPWSIWISYSPDLIHWGDSRRIIQAQQYHWDEMKIGPGAAPIKTPQGWLNIYHGVFPTMAGAVYRLGVALHDLHDPARVIAVGDRWILQPQDPWEISGYVPNVVFSCGAVPEDNGEIKLYWGAADSVMCAGTTTVERLLQHCLESSRPAL